ncbi:tetratricopeptide repeat-containing sulfotransferase family protein [Dokdonella immobilis]|uniref:TPR repeat-containing protein n=1 Tax=Dokdonella immobilis TaxID=578942 RepID=A0A1I4W6S0_9GAMM|nr:sulfotransferase [Dokdonella immobilis]SFN09092.1 TPR repeat-containing protein [Dokdonella immobilis]
MQELIDNIVAAMKAGRHADALSMSRTLVQSFPNDEGALSMLALGEQNAGDMRTARNLLLGLTRDHPGTWQHWNNLGNVQRLLGDFNSAGEAYQRALALHQDSPRLRANLGLLHLNLGEFAQARDQLCAASVMHGAEPGMRIWAAVACHACADDDSALQLVHGWPQWSTGSSEEAMLELGWLLFQLGDTRSGEAILSTEFQDSKVRMRALARRVLARERLNLVKEAAELTARMSDPTGMVDLQAKMETLHALALIAARNGELAIARHHYESALQLEAPPRYKQNLYFGLAKVCDRLDDPAAAMDALKQAHADVIVEHASEEKSRLEGTGLLSLLDPKFESDPESVQACAGAPEERESPVFVVGFPRSGTTLLEQMLSAHPAFMSADERPMVQRMLEHLRQQGLDYPAALAQLGAGQCATLRDIYWQEAAKTVQRSDGVRLIDKHPLNFLALPLIRRIFPEAPLIFCVRHPCDSLLSSYMQNFRDPRLAAECASIERLADLYLRLGQRWIRDSQLYPGRLLVSRHEDLIADAEAHLRRIADFLGIEDSTSMLDFSTHARARGFIGTPSYAQVVQGLNADAVGRWKRYRSYLEPALPVLAPIMDHWGYAA